MRRALQLLFISMLTISFVQLVSATESTQTIPYAEGFKASFPCFFAVLGVTVLFSVVICLLVLRIKQLKTEMKVGKMTDGETGMGNLQFFKYNFKRIMSENSLKHYYLAYFVLDSSCLRHYHRGITFDEMLSYTASVLPGQTEDGEFTARIGDSGFAFAFCAEDVENAKSRLCNVVDILNSFNNSGKENQKPVYHSAVCPLEKNDKSCENLLFNLRKNCNKILNTDEQIIYCDSHLMNAALEEKQTVDSLVKGLANKEFKMYLQFIVDNQTKQIVSAELLSRWDSSEKGLLYPGEYIADLETSGLISEHDFYMFELACRQLEKWQETELGNITLSCNFTRITLSEKDFIDRITEISNRYCFDKAMLAIEITEDAIEVDKGVARQNVMYCRELGFKVYLDDLGSGYTSLMNLCDYLIDVVKLDRDVLLKTEMGKGKDLFSGLIALAHSLNIRVVCEGVETEEQNALVSESDCDFIQGWYYTKALPPEECEAFVAQYRSA